LNPDSQTISYHVNFEYSEPDIIYGLTNNIENTNGFTQTYLDKPRNAIITSSEIA